MTVPVVGFYGFFTDSAEEAMGAKKTAIRVAHFVLGLIFYPLLGAIALVGMISKSLHAWNISSFNEGTIQQMREAVNEKKEVAAPKQRHVLFKTFEDIEAAIQEVRRCRFWRQRFSYDNKTITLHLY